MKKINCCFLISLKKAAHLYNNNNVSALYLQIAATQLHCCYLMSARSRSAYLTDLQSVI